MQKNYWKNQAFTFIMNVIDSTTSTIIKIKKLLD